MVQMMQIDDNSMCDLYSDLMYPTYETLVELGPVTVGAAPVAGGDARSGGTTYPWSA